ncbi:MAG: hypothetical protein V3V49_12780 [Candidatus Krumholzibacteria bacterium]
MKAWMAMALLVLLAAGDVHATGVSRPRIQVNGSLAIPIRREAFADDYSLGFGGGIGFVLPVSPSFNVSGTVDFTTFELDADSYISSRQIPPPASIAGGEISVLYVAGNLKWNVLSPQESSVRPYILLGGGYFRLATDDIVIPTSTTIIKTEHVVGWHGGWGIDLALGSAISLFFDALYIVGLTQKATGYVPVRVGLTFDLVPQI